MRATGFRGTLSEESKVALLAYTWPGNVRELENAVTHATVLASGEMICSRDLPDQVICRHLANHCLGTLADEKAAAVRSAIEQSRGNLQLAARKLGVGKSTLYRWIHRPEFSRTT